MSRKSAFLCGWHGSCEALGTGFIFAGVKIMANKFETLAFAIGFLTFVALPLA